MKLKKNNFKKYKFFQDFFVIILFLLLTDACLAQQKSPDAIALRVIANDNHYSPTYWYNKNIKLPGSPQSLIVDGYEAVRDGRTVYINAANINNNSFYTNIYVLSYNQNAENATVDIFGQMLMHWKFNNNLTTNGACHNLPAQICLYNEDCDQGDYCLSEKAKLIRDTKRLADLADLKILAENFKETNSYFPKLVAGSYLPGKSLSVWPSWQETLGKNLGATLPIDPINLSGNCAGYAKDTCWDEKLKRFADPTPGDNNFNFPADSHVYGYSVSSDGLTSYFCAVTESTSVPANLGGNCLNN